MENETKSQETNIQKFGIHGDMKLLGQKITERASVRIQDGRAETLTAYVAALMQGVDERLIQIARIQRSVDSFRRKLAAIETGQFTLDESLRIVYDDVSLNDGH